MSPDTNGRTTVRCDRVCPHVVAKDRRELVEVVSLERVEAAGEELPLWRVLGRVAVDRELARGER
jgi:hypothetical protein